METLKKKLIKNRWLSFGDKNTKTQNPFAPPDNSRRRKSGRLARHFMAQEAEVLQAYELAYGTYLCEAIGRVRSQLFFLLEEDLRASFA